jgi:hypothetical protein
LDENGGKVSEVLKSRGAKKKENAYENVGRVILCEPDKLSKRIKDYLNDRCSSGRTGWIS